MALTHETICYENIVFEEVKKCSYGPSVTYNRIPIKYRNGKNLDELCIETPVFQTYGIQENRDEKTGELQSYSLSLCVTNTDTVEMFERIVEKCKEHMRKPNTIAVIGKQAATMAEFMDVFWRKRDPVTKKIVPGASPTMYPKLLTVFEKTKTGNPPEISTDFYDNQDNKIDDVKSMIGVRANVKAAIIVRDIYIGSTKPSIQLKVNDVTVVEKISGRRRMLAPMKGAVIESVFSAKPDVLATSEDEAEPRNDVPSEDEEVAAPIKQLPPSSVVKTNKIVRKKTTT